MADEENVTKAESLSKRKKEKLRRGKWQYVDQYTLVVKLTYFLLGAKTSSFEPYMIVFLVSIGLTPVEAGLIGGIRLIGAVIGGVFWGFVADYKKQYRLIIGIVCIGSIVTMGLQPLLSVWIGDKEKNICQYTAKHTNTSTFGGSFTKQNKSVTSEQSTQISSSNILFYAILLVNVISKFLEGPHISFTDSGAVEKCRILPHKPNFGSQRMFGAVGFAAGIMISNIFVDHFPKSSVSCYTAIFIVYGILTSAFSFSILTLYEGLTFEDESTKSDGVDILKKLWKIGNIDAVMFFTTVLVMGTEQGFYIGFTFVLLKEMGAPTIINGLSIAAASLTCIGSFLFGSAIIQKLGGTWYTILMCCFTYFLRFISMAYTQNPWLMPLIQTFQSTSFAIFTISAVFHVKEISPPEVRTTVYSIMNTLHYGLGCLLANIIGGNIVASKDTRFLFRMACLIALLWSILLALYFTFLRIKGIFERKELKAEEMRMI